MKKYCEMSREELLDLKKELDREFDEIKSRRSGTGYVPW